MIFNEKEENTVIIWFYLSNYLSHWRCSKNVHNRWAAAVYCWTRASQGGEGAAAFAAWTGRWRRRWWRSRSAYCTPEKAAVVSAGYFLFYFFIIFKFLSIKYLFPIHFFIPFHSIYFFPINFILVQLKYTNNW